jgi:hypothetical protein
VGGVRVNSVESGNGPWLVNYNAIQGSYDLRDINYPSNLDTTNNIQETSGVVDVNGDLTATYSANIGTHGWQFADGSTPMDGTFTPPGGNIGGGTGRAPYSAGGRVNYSPSSFARYAE